MADAGDPPVAGAQLLASRAHGFHGIAGAKHIVGFQQAGDFACAFGEAGEENGAMGTGLVAGRSDAAAKLCHGV